jgi:SAM-dependent methyltransferase
MTPVAERERSTVEPVAAGEAIGGFIDGIVRKKNGHIPGARLQRLAARLVPANSRTAIRRLVTDAASPLQRRKAAGLVEGAARLHLGSGELPRDGWVNVDLAGAPVDLVWNLNRRLPFPDRSIDAVFHEHLLEHLTMDRALALTRECHRVLKPGGVLRIAVPDARRHVEWYCRDTLPPERAGHATPLM